MSSLLDYEVKEQEDLKSYLTFELDKELFAVEVHRVVEIQEMVNITKIPNAPAHMAGVLNLRGKILPLIDTKVKFGLSPVVPSVNTCIVVIEMQIEGETTWVGTLVDAVREVVSIPEEAIQKSPSIKAKFDLSFIHSTFKIDKDFVMILDLNKTFALEQDSHRIDHNEDKKSSR